MAPQCCGAGTVFKLDTTGQLTTLYAFCTAANCTDGRAPTAALIQDAAGNLYSTTTVGGANSNPVCGSNGCGTVFKLDKMGRETVAYSFCSAANCADGAKPQAELIQDAAVVPKYADHPPPMTEECVAGICRALGARGEFKPLIKGELTDGVSSGDGGGKDGVMDIAILS